MKAKEARLVTVVLPNWNGEELLRKCMGSLTGQDYPNYEIILVDDFSQDGSVRYVEKNYPGVRIVRNGRNLGFAGSINEGFKRAKGDYVVFVNNDMVFEKAWLSKLVEKIRSDGRLAAVSSNLVNAFTGKPEEFNKPILNVLGYTFSFTEGFEEPTYPPGGALICLKSAIDLPFDSDYKYYGEDVYLGLMLRMRGHKIANADDANVRHYHSATMGRYPYKKMYYGERNSLLNLLLFYEATNIARIIPLLLVSNAVRDLADIIRLKKRFWPRWKAHFWVLTHLNLISGKRKAVQGRRVVPDSEILKYMTCRVLRGGSRASGAVNFLSRAYCRVLGIKTREFYA